MQSKILIFLILLLSGCSSIALAIEINVTDADTVWNMTLDNATDVSHLVGEPGVMVVKYADAFSYQLFENATDIGRLVGEPGVMVVKYADTISYELLENATSVGRLIDEPGVMVVKYADTISYQPLKNATSVSHLTGEPGVMVVKYADTISYDPLENPTSVSRRELNISIDYPSNGDIILNSSVTVNGTAFSPNEIINVTVNGILANGTTSWNATIPLTTGINTITVKATTNTTYSETKTIKVFHYVEGECSYYDIDGDGVIDIWDQENNTQSGFWVNPHGIGRMLGDLNGNGMLDSGDVTLLMRKIAGLIT